MSIQFREIALTLEEEERDLPEKVGSELGFEGAQILSWRIVRRGIDARRKPQVLRTYTVEFELADEDAFWHRHGGHPRLQRVVPPSPIPLLPVGKDHRVLVVGMGPAGLFCALRLADYGMRVTIVEQGRPVEERLKDVERFWSGGVLDPSSNVQFGEGGAGTFSDGKLTTRKNHPAIRFVLETLVGFGAPQAILEQAKPHVGSDRLRRVLVRFRQGLQSRGVELRFETRLTGIECGSGGVAAGILNDTERLTCDSLVLAPGHSARQTYRMLAETGVAMESKPFAVGVRVEHPAELINRIQYGLPRHPKLPAAEYALTHNDRETGRGIYSFCMCPGGEVVNAASEPEGLAVNGMSLLQRDGGWSNSALVVSVRPDDFPGSGPLAGVVFQQDLERRAFFAGGGDFSAPAQSLLAFLDRPAPPPRSTCRPGIREADLKDVLPAFVSDGLHRALPQFEKRMRGFLSAEATLVGVETRTSAPVRIVRGENGESASHRGLYPAGEGAGYAGGIVSSALDGIRTAERIAEKVRT